MSASFRAAVEARDVAAMHATLAEDVVFRSPVAHKPYAGKAITAAILAHVIEVFEDFRYVRELADADNAGGHALVFEARVDGLDITGCDFLVLDDDGLITDFMVMVRPLKAAQALADAMGARFDKILAMAADH